ncbi:secretion system type I outer membrane efflux pump lipoprotein NodT [Gluconobacter thailandicus F149-1 = NBRC 100600]|uniref:Secretion system type I outer membrane efflux pump lipoprotein NodT n=1 Tax=Gluconobacter thailandicus NBRC 3257 TaxID=1381097 RepID=A0ABQ0IU03_GLUTH|nr:efflux transporter outer membrane subunit [Gluconobacter thailandicus]KXV54617.1 transporter [Gluconobacter thailandicus]GAD25703.1 secretion system type I outer membrane efflux pump lipoprotein NodT [Gluconobacter thailandicus NBRC 3257]GAN94732.1 secretion system type I outer membrane efflux pump lipoprotein NodT [Gluconobacter thailandicus F149-1 = NBRC 100600]GBR60131.1 secretion system type I outer membrane efflux pump lipoprotein NodT [Gluconobacter thailandicus F149-1 = NBRC 100600]G
MMRSSIKILTVGMALMLGGCTMIPDYHRPTAPIAKAWPDKVTEVAVSDTANLENWRDFYRDPVLQSLIEAALTNNRDLQIAQHQVEASSAQFDIENAALFPTLNGTAGASVQKMNSRIWSLSQGDGPFYMRQYAVGFGVSAYEVDLWGRIRSASRASFDRYVGDELGRESMRLSIIASVSTAMLNWVANNQALLVTQNVLENRRHTYNLVKQTADVGTGTQLDVAEAEAAMRDAETNLQIYTRQRDQAMNQIELLVGTPLTPGTRQELEHKASLEDVVPFPDVPEGLPSDMIARRPDILSAEQVLRAANDDIGAARAEFFPKIQITAANGTASNNITRLFQSGMGAWNVAPQITLPLFDAGRLTAQLHQAKAHRKEEVSHYEKTVQTAFREVADALAGRSTYLEQLQAQTLLVDASHRQYQLALARFKGGYDPYLETLVAQRALYDAQLGAIRTRLQQMSNTITLYKTLGGGWNMAIPQRKDTITNHVL